MPLLLTEDGRRQRGDVDRGVGERVEDGADHHGIERRQVALEIDDDVVAAVGIEGFGGFEDAVRPGGMIGPGHDGQPTGPANSLGDLGGVGRHQHGAEFRLHGPAPNVNDHRLAADVGERLTGQPRRPHAGRNKDQGLDHATGWVAPGPDEPEGSRRAVAIRSAIKALKRLPTSRQNS